MRALTARAGRALDAVLQRGPASEIHLALEPLPEPLRQRDRPAVLAIDQADDARPPERFESVGNFASYARCVQAKRMSNDKKKGE